jgi:hypothetical protein
MLPRAAKPVMSLLSNLGSSSSPVARQGKLKWLLQAAFPSRETMAEYMAVHHSLPLNPVRNYTCYLTRAIDWLPRGARLAWHCVIHRRQAAFYASEIHQPRLWDWLVSDGKTPRPPDR